MIKMIILLQYNYDSYNSSHDSQQITIINKEQFVKGELPINMFKLRLSAWLNTKAFYSVETGT